MGDSSGVPLGKPAPCEMTPAAQLQPMARKVAMRAPPENPVKYTLRKSMTNRARVSRQTALAAACWGPTGPLRELLEPTTM
jgi:hypothetical protein